MFLASPETLLREFDCEDDNDDEAEKLKEFYCITVRNPSRDVASSFHSRLGFINCVSLILRALGLHFRLPSSLFRFDVVSSLLFLSSEVVQVSETKESLCLPNFLPDNVNEIPFGNSFLPTTRFGIKRRRGW